ncbi:MAG: glutathione S-transferase family protein [Gammaproteobacteria bacterium]
MYHIHGFNLSFNTTKVLYVAEELGIEFTYTALDPMKGEHKTPEHLKRHPMGKTPTLDHDGKYVFESSAICRYLGNVEGSALYPADDAYQRALVDQWMDFFTSHPGRWLGTLLFERVFREQFGMGEKKEDVEKEALGFLEEQMSCVNEHLASNEFLAGKALSIADPFAFAYVETSESSGFPLGDYPHVSKWYEGYETRSSVKRVQARIGQS